MVFLQPTCLVEAVSFRRTSDETTDEMQLENQTDDIHSTTAFSLSQSQIRMSQAKKTTQRGEIPHSADFFRFFILAHLLFVVYFGYPEKINKKTTRKSRR